MFKGGMGNIMKQAQQMQERMQKSQEELAKIEGASNLQILYKIMIYIYY